MGMNYPAMKMNALLLVLLTLLSCDEQAKLEYASYDAMPAGKAASKEYVFEEALDIEVNQDLKVPPANQVIERKLIRNGSMTIEVKEIISAKAEVEKICKLFNGYTSSESKNNFDDRIQYDQTIRVPAKLFDSLLNAIEKIAKKVETKSINSEDVTEEFIDVEARLKTKKELELRYREILKQAHTVADIVSIENQIATVRSEIESMEGRLNYLKNQIAFSTLNLTYYEMIGTDFGFASKFVNALGNGWDNLLSFLIGLISIWPFVVIIGALVIVGWKTWRKRAAKEL